MSVVLDRLSPQDLYNRLDWIRDDWDCDEQAMARKLVALRRMFEHLPSRYYEEAAPLLEDLCHARLVRNGAYLPALLELRGIVREWDQHRAPLLHCERCSIAVRGHDAMLQHVELIHDGEAGT